jgi:hypothetical protein
MSDPNNLGQITCGSFETEAQAVSFFDSHINQDFFVIEHEVKGRRLFDDKPVKEDGQNLRIDKILHPTQKTYNAGWLYGPIGVEIKRSNEAVGPVLTQILEQRQSIFQSRYLHNTRILPAIFILFPCESITHDLHSLCERQLIYPCHWDDSKNKMRIGASVTILTIGQELFVNPNWKPSIKKGHQGRQK